MKKLLFLFFCIIKSNYGFSFEHYVDSKKSASDVIQIYRNKRNTKFHYWSKLPRELREYIILQHINSLLEARYFVDLKKTLANLKLVNKKISSILDDLFNSRKAVWQVAKKINLHTNLPVSRYQLAKIFLNKKSFGKLYIKDLENANTRGNALLNFIKRQINRPIEETYKNDLKIIKSLIKEGANVDYTESGYQFNQERTPLIFAAAWGMVDIVKILIAAGANVNLETANGKTALSSTISYRESENLLVNKLEIVKELIEFGATVNPLKNYITSALHGAAENNALEILNILILCGANLEAKDEQHRTALMNAIGRGSIHCVKALIAAGAKIDIPAEDTYVLDALKRHPEIKLLLFK